MGVYLNRALAGGWGKGNTNSPGSAQVQESAGFEGKGGEQVTCVSSNNNSGNMRKEENVAHK